MEFSVKKYDLLGALNLTQGVVERKTTARTISAMYRCSTHTAPAEALSTG
jgi:hypothetical protein